MPKSLSNAALTLQAADCVFPKPTPAKVEDVRPTTTGSKALGEPSLGDTPVAELWFATGAETHGKQNNQALEAGKERANYIRDAKKAAALLHRLGPAFCASFGVRLWQRYGPALETPQQRAHRTIDAIQADLNELRAFINSTEAK